MKTQISKDKSKFYWKIKLYEYKALLIPLIIQTAILYFMFDLNEQMDNFENYNLAIMNVDGPLRDRAAGMMIMGFVWLFREYRWVNLCQSRNIHGYLPQSSFGNASLKHQPKISDLENQISKVTTEKRSIIKSMMVLIESMRSILDESKNLRIPITIPINDFRNEEMILTIMKKLKQNIKKVCEQKSGDSEIDNSKNLIDEKNLLKEANQNLKKDLKAAQKEAKMAKRRAQCEVNALNNDLACHNQQSIFMENELKDLKKKNKELSERIQTSTRTVEDLKHQNQQSCVRIKSFGVRLAGLENENVELKSKLEKAQSKLKSVKVDETVTDRKSQIDILENANKTLQLENSRLREENECSICCEEVTRASELKWEAFVPCGHRYCSACARNICSGKNGHNQRVCPNCRREIERIQTVYDT